MCHRVVFPHARTDASFHLVRGPHLVSRRLGGRDDLLAECRDNSQLGNPLNMNHTAVLSSNDAVVSSNDA